MGKQNSREIATALYERATEYDRYYTVDYGLLSVILLPVRTKRCANMADKGSTKLIASTKITLKYSFDFVIVLLMVRHKANQIA